MVPWLLCRPVVTPYLFVAQATTIKQIIHELTGSSREKNKLFTIVRPIAVVDGQVPQHIHDRNNLGYAKDMKLVKKEIVKIRPYRYGQFLALMIPAILMAQHQVNEIGVR